MSKALHSTLTSILAIVLPLLILGSTAWAESPGPAAISAPSSDAPQIEHAEYWRARAQDAHARIATAQTELDEANGAVTRMRRNNHPRGDARRLIVEEQQRAQSAYDEAVRALEVDLRAEARSAGASAHWLNAPQ